MKTPLVYAALLLCFGLVRPGYADDSEGAFRLYFQSVEIPERGAVKECAVVVRTNRFCFLPPYRWSVRAGNEANCVVMQPDDLSVCLVISWLGPIADSAAASSTNSWRELVARRFADSQILQEFAAYAQAGEARGFDLDRTVQDGRHKIASRVAFVPCGGGLVEIALTASPRRLEAFHPAFSQAVASFKAQAIDPGPGDLAWAAADPARAGLAVLTAVPRESLLP